MEQNNKIEKIFENLQKWRCLPKYRFEERIDIFLSVYLEEILTAQISELKENKHKIIEIIPQFPLKKKLNNQSENTDYAIIVKDNEDEKILLYLLELKTDKTSINEKQIKYYENVQEIETVEIFNGIKSIQSKSKKAEKYDNLMCILELHGLAKKEEAKWKIAEEKLKGNPKIIYMLPNINEENIKEKRIIEITKNNSWQMIFFKDIIKIINEEDKITIGLKKLMEDIIKEE